MTSLAHPPPPGKFLKWISKRFIPRLPLTTPKKFSPEAIKNFVLQMQSQVCDSDAGNRSPLPNAPFAGPPQRIVHCGIVNHVAADCTCLYGYKGPDCIYQWAPTSALKDGDDLSKLNTHGSNSVWLLVSIIFVLYFCWGAFLWIFSCLHQLQYEKIPLLAVWIVVAI